jgi:hypothetical protein
MGSVSLFERERGARQTTDYPPTPPRRPGGGGGVQDRCFQLIAGCSTSVFLGLGRQRRSVNAVGSQGRSERYVGGFSPWSHTHVRAASQLALGHADFLGEQYVYCKQFKSIQGETRMDCLPEFTEVGARFCKTDRRHSSCTNKRVEDSDLLAHVNTNLKRKTFGDYFLFWSARQFTVRATSFRRP